jgi:secreted trypsin-like serine protease
MAQLPVVSTAECSSSGQDLFSSMTRSTSYCAGYKNGTQVCNGDSGGGHYFRATIREATRWYIQGLVSYGLPDADKKTCTSSHYAIFNRVGRYGDWLLRTLATESLL